MLQDEAVRYIIERGLDEKIARSTGPLIRYNDMFCLNTMTGAIKVHGTCLGRAMMIERNHAFGDSDREVFEFFVRLLAQELQKGGFLSLGGPQQGPYFLSRLLDDEIPNPITCTRKIFSIAIPLRRRYTRPPSSTPAAPARQPRAPHASARRGPRGHRFASNPARVNGAKNLPRERPVDQTPGSSGPSRVFASLR